MSDKKVINYLCIILLIWIMFCFVFIHNSSALTTRLSNESILAKELLVQAEEDILEMIEKEIPIVRVNETYQEAMQLYSAQLALEEKGGRADYKLVIAYASDINSVKKISIQASDELTIFNETYLEAESHYNLSEMQEEYNLVLLSFKEERYEDTLELIKKGYDRISDIQSSQTALNSIYFATSTTIKNFFVKNWLKLLIISFLILFFILIFWRNFKKLRIRIKINNLFIQKKAIGDLLKNLQKDYFKARKISESEYNIKLKKFKELIRDIDRKVMVLKEDLFKLRKNKKKNKQKNS